MQENNDNSSPLKLKFILALKHKFHVIKRVQILNMLCEGLSMQYILRIADVSINTVTKLLVYAGEACAAYHDANAKGLACKRRL